MHHRTLSIFFIFLAFVAYLVGGTPVPRTKKEYHTVQQAIHGIGREIDSGSTATVYKLKGLYQGEKAVVKVRRLGPTGDHWAPDPRKEAHNAHNVGQLLGHGHDPKTDTHYLVMKNMGVSAKRAKLKDGIQALNKEAEQRYKKYPGVHNKDKNGNNFVYHSRNGPLQAEIIDWAKMGFEAGHTYRVNPMQVEQVTGPKKKKLKCPTCVIM